MAIDAIEFPDFQPAMRVISSITNSKPAIVTTTFDNQYVTGTLVRLFIPDGFGMIKANQLQGLITVIDNVTFSIPIDTRYFDPFVIPMTFPQNQQFAQAIPIGEDNSILSASTKNVLPYSAT